MRTIKDATKDMTPAERFQWVEKYIYLPLRIESIDSITKR